MRRLHHLLIFAPGRGARGDGGGDKRKVNRKLRGLFVFFISGVYHEVLLLSLFRRTSGENLLFFTLQGLIVLLEINVREKTGYKQDVSGWIKVLCYVCFWTSLAVSGRVFLAPFLRFFSIAIF
ncbi:hypothetical protein BDB00DRAFT_471260 [Zychaea mexicana]|uniref:uncharacterized protein n=1 Tax=Zychaea mexicana TaxID=64656 RepID=UPI0022FDC2A4|nr:uncharacterized protein BDB00DRAFT_471260 [Zychaea mexicana]KAI9491750.1 hypothetical protein BDB00DRAFT_471260 [Zychaea mexicana]